MTSRKFTKLNHTLKIIFKITFQIVELRLFEIVPRPISRSPVKPVPASNRYPVSLFPPRSARHADQRACACSRDRRRDRRRRESLSFSLCFPFSFFFFSFSFFFFSYLFSPPCRFQWNMDLVHLFCSSLSHGYLFNQFKYTATDLTKTVRSIMVDIRLFLVFFSAIY